MKWKVPELTEENEGHHLGRRCQRCKDEKKKDCQCDSGTCTAGTECQCAKAGKCCKCCCTGSCGNCKKECSCVEDNDKGTYKGGHRIYNDSYQSAYGEMSFPYIGEEGYYLIKSVWSDLLERGNGKTPSQRRHHCARILLGSVCLIWSGITYMYWTGKYAKGSPRWNNHILDGSGLDDGTLSQWLQALGFPRDMLNNHGPGNRWDAVIWDGFRGMLYLGFPDTGSGSGHGWDTEGNTFRDPSSMNYAGYIHTLEKGAFCSNGNVFPKNANGTTSITDEQMHKCGALFKLYILSCAYFTGLQKRNSESTPRTPRTIREILYWLSALPYSQAYKKMLTYGKERLKEVLKKPGETESSSAKETQLKFYQDKRPHPITVHEFNLFAHFQAVTQYCPLVLIGIQGGLKDTDSTKEPPIHSLYANTECRFTYPTVSIQAYNQVVHYIRALFYQLYFLRKQCAVKVTYGGKWRECRYGKDVVSHGVISWMCLGCDPMEHDRKSRVDKVKGEILKGVKGGGDAGKLKDVLEAIGEVVVQLGNAQEALEGKAESKVIEGVKDALSKAKEELVKVKDGLKDKLDEAKKKLDALTNGGGALDTLVKGDSNAGSLHQVATASKEYDKDYSSAKDRISAAIDGIHKALVLLKEGVEKQIKEEAKEAENSLKTFFNITKADKELESVLKQELSYDYTALLSAINKLISICSTSKCPPCHEHAKKCGKPPVPRQCRECHQQYMDGTPSPLQAFLEDRLPGFSCQKVLDQDSNQPQYPPAASHLDHCNGSGQCCPLPMGFRGQFQKGITHTGQRHHLASL